MDFRFHVSTFYGPSLLQNSGILPKSKSFTQVHNFSTDRFSIINDTGSAQGFALSGGSLVLTAIPEPSTNALLLAMGAFGMLLWFRHRPRVCPIRISR